MKKYLLLLSSVLLLGSTPVVSAQSEIELEEQVQELVQELKTTLNNLREARESNLPTVGEPVIYDSGVIITIDSVAISDEEPNYPELGGTLVKIEFTIDNQTNTEVDYNGHDVELYDGDRVKTEIDSKDFWSENIAPGMVAKGHVYRHVHSLGNLTIVVEDGRWTAEVE